MTDLDTAEQRRLAEAREKGVAWRKWGPYLSERQWGTVREDYSDNGDAWDYFTHDQARSRAYRWGEDGLAGISDDKQRLCFALALWNGQDPILKERLFGLTNTEGNHGEDVKEYYFYLDTTPTHSYMKWLYKYPQRAYPYDDLVETNRAAQPRTSSSTSCSTPASSTATATSTSSSSTPRPAPRTSSSASPSPTAARSRRRCTSCRRSGSATRGRGGRSRAEADRCAGRAGRGGHGVVAASHAELGERWLYLRGRRAAALHRERDQHPAALRHAERQPLRQGRHQRLRRPRPARRGQPGRTGTKAAAHYQLTIAARDERGAAPAPHATSLPSGCPIPSADFDADVRRPGATRPTSSTRHHPALGERGRGAASCARRSPACCGPSSTTSSTSTSGSTSTAPIASPAAPAPVRNRDWFHMVNDDVISMPDKWEYPWYAAWDLAFHTIALARSTSTSPSSSSS